MCGSGVGCFVFAPLANFLLDHYGWKGANLIFAALCFNCAICGALMRPLELVIETREQPVFMAKSPTSPRILVEDTILLEETEPLKEEDEVEFEQEESIQMEAPKAKKRTGSESLSPIAMKQRLQSRNNMKRNVSTPGFGRLARMDSLNEKEQFDNRRASSYLVYAVETGSTQHLKPM